MRIYGLIALSVLSIGPTLTQAEPLKPAKSDNPPLSDIQKCEEKLKSLQSLSARVRRTGEDKVYRSKEVYEGEIRYLQPNMVMIEMHNKDKPTIEEKMIRSRDQIYLYNPSDKTVDCCPLRKQKSENRVNMLFLFEQFVTFLSSTDFPTFFPMSGDWTKFRRLYDLRQVKANVSYIHVEVIPKSPEGKAFFEKARLVIRKDNYLPCEWWFQQPNGNEIRWDFLSITENPALKAKEFTDPTIPPGWKLRKEPKSD